MTIHQDHGPAVRPLSDHSRAAVRSELLDAIHRGPETRSTRKRTVIITAAVASIAAALVAGSSLLAGQDPANGSIVLAAAAGQIPSSTMPCRGAEAIDASAVEGITYLLDDPPAPLRTAWARVDECPDALPLAIFIKATGTPNDSALTLWGPDAQAGGINVEAIEGAYTIELSGSGTDAWVVEFPWGAWVQWSDDTGDYIITSAGIDVDTATAAATAYSATTNQESVQAVVPDLQLVPITERPARTATWSASYGDGTGEPGDDTPWLSLDVTVGGAPDTARVSTEPIPATGLTLPQVTTSDVRTGDNGGGTQVAPWTTETGAEIRLMGNFPEEEMRAFAEQVRAVLPDDPRTKGM